MTRNITTGAALTSAEIADRDMALSHEREKQRLARLTPAQRERERLHFAEKRRVAIAEIERELQEIRTPHLPQ
jgi:hypothetical protein